MVKSSVITYPKYKQEAYSKFNTALVNFLLSSGGISTPFSSSITPNTSLGFTANLRYGGTPTVDILLSMFPVAMLRKEKLSNGSLSWVLFKFKSNHTEVEILVLDSKTASLLEEFLKTFSKLPDEANKLKMYYGAVTVLQDSLCYSVYRDSGASLKFSTKILKIK